MMGKMFNFKCQRPNSNKLGFNMWAYWFICLGRMLRFAQRIKQLQGTRLGFKILRSSGLSHSDSIYDSSLIVSAWIYLSIIESGNSTQLHNFNAAISAEAKFSPKVNQFSSV